MPRGTVKWFNNKEGFGFILDPLVEGDIFVHYTVIEGGGYRTLEQGEEVEYELGADEKGARALRVVRIASPEPRERPLAKLKKRIMRWFSWKKADPRPHGST